MPDAVRIDDDVAAKEDDEGGYRYADAELAAALKRVNRIYSARAVGDDESAKAWGVFVGAVRETLNACE